MESIYLDHNATTPIWPEVLDAIDACWRLGLANPASLHAAGQHARQVVERARDDVASRLGAVVDARPPDSVIWTSGGTEANNLAMFGLAAAAEAQFGPGRLILSRLEHPSVVGPAEQLARAGWEVVWIDATRSGTVPVDALDPWLGDGRTRLVSLMLGNNETGVIQPVGEWARRCRAAGAWIHTDAVQAVGKIPVDLRALGVDALSFAPHKFHGPVGIGALVVRGELGLSPRLFGGFQQRGLRPGTEPTPLIVGLQRSLALAVDSVQERAAHLYACRDRFERQLLAECPELVVHGAVVERLPHTSNVAFVGVERQTMLLALDRVGVRCSAGSACASGSSEPSPTLVAMGLEPAWVRSSLRFSFGLTNTQIEVDEAVGRTIDAYRRLRRQGTSG